MCKREMYMSGLQDRRPKTAASSHMVLSNSDLTYCQELGCSWLLDVSKSVVLQNNESVVQWTVVQKRAQSSS